MVTLEAPWGEPCSTVGGQLGPFWFRRAWVYWVVRGSMSAAHARAINDAPRDSLQVTRYSGGRETWGAVIRANGCAGGDSVDDRGCDVWHVDTPDGLRYFADKVREFEPDVTLEAE